VGGRFPANLSSGKCIQMNVRDIEEHGMGMGMGMVVVVVVGGGIVLRAGRSADAARTGSQWQRGLSEELNTCT